jgi:hypothetical protein
MGADGRRGLVIFVFGVIGILMVAMEQMSYDNNYVLPAYIDNVTVTLVGVQVLTIVFALLLGVIFALIVIKD